jgi:hypothetical protein
MSAHQTSVPRGLLAGIFLSSAAAITFEITLTRVFSISIGHHFAAMVISIGMLGIGLSGTLQSLIPKLKEPRRLGFYAVMLCASATIGYLLMNYTPLDPARLTWDPLQLAYIGLFYVFLAVPFFFFGLIISASLSANSDQAGTIYGADLLGAGTGAFLSFLLTGALGAGRAVLAASVIAAAGAFVFGKRRPALMLFMLLAVTIILDPAFTHVRMSQYRGLEQALKYPGARHIRTYETGFSRVDTFTSPAVRYAPGLNINYLDPLPLQTGLAIDGGALTAITNATGGSLRFLENLPAALPYEIKKRASVLAADPQGGLPVLMARRYGANDITSIESNPLVVSVITDDYRSISGGLYQHNTFTGLARSRLGGFSDFDLIDLSLMGAMPSGMFGAFEDYRLTVEAFKTYLEHIPPDGMLTISLYLIPPPRAELRVLTTAVEALKAMDIARPEQHIAAIRSFATLTIVVKKTPLISEEIERLKKFTEDNGFDLVYFPGITPSESNVNIQMPEDFYYEFFSALLSARCEAFVENYVFDIAPVHDDRPFFNYFLKMSTYGEAYDLMGRKWQFFLEEGWLQPAIFIQAALLSLVMLSLPAFFRKRLGISASPYLAYFALIGLAFMFVEVPLIQKLILPIENPSHAFALVLCALLISSGIGSRAGQKYQRLSSPKIVLLLSLALITYGMLVLHLGGVMTVLPISARFAASFVLILPMGFLMGLPFPLGIRALGRKSPAVIPWAWAFNGCFSVLAPLLATMSAMAAGFRGVFLAGAVMYALAFLSIRKAT